MILLALTLTSALVAPVRVWDNVFAPSELSTLRQSGDRREHSFTSVFDRKIAPKGRTVLETALASVLDEMGDDAQFVEYWWRGEWKSIEAHRDVDETLCISKLHAAGKVGGLQRCPDHGHVLYVDVEDSVRGPTCLWEESAFDGASATPTTSEVTGPEGEDLRAGTPRELTALHVVPCNAGRLLRFPGELLHAVPRPTCQWLDEAEPSTSGDGDSDGEEVAPQPKRRAVLLFNTWTTPPMVPDPHDPPPPKYVDELERLDMPPRCRPHANWLDASVAVADDEDHSTPAKVVHAPLLGDVRRRNSHAPALAALADVDDFRAALTSKSTVHRVALAPVSGASADAVAALTDADEEMVSAETAAAEEVAVKVGYLDYMEDEFFDLGDDEEEDDDDEEEEDDDAVAMSSDFLANLAALRGLEEGRQPP